ncbi:MAG: DNA polymerase beta superfamily protein, partial [Persicimonas sp.]
RPPAQFLSVWSGAGVHGFDSPLRLGGVVVQPAEVVLGIRGWEDAFEQTLDLEVAERPVPVALFEIEKIVRMMLHQSGLAFEILTSPAVLCDTSCFDARAIVEAAITTEIVHHYRDIAGGWLERLAEAEGRGASAADVLDVFRHALTGLGLMRGEVDLRLWATVERYADAELEGLLREVQRGAKIAGELLDELLDRGRRLVAGLSPEDAALPARPNDYDGLDDLVVSLRQAC